jgi:hypothetical protein
MGIVDGVCSRHNNCYANHSTPVGRVGSALSTLFRRDHGVIYPVMGSLDMVRVRREGEPRQAPNVIHSNEL